MKKELKPTKADTKIAKCLRDSQSFAVIAGAGSGKTTSLVTALQLLRKSFGKKLTKNGQRVVCITYTNRAVDVIASKLGFDELFLVSTLHGFLWGEISRFSNDIRESLRTEIIPKHISKAQEKDNGGTSNTAIKAREKVARLSKDLAKLDDVPIFKYDDSTSSNYPLGILNHDDVIDVAAHLILTKPILRKALGFKYPYFFVDEAQDTFDNIVTALNSICSQEGLPLVGYFGDPMQQIYDKRAGDFSGPDGSQLITKTENFRCSTSVIELLNAFRSDVQQFAAGENADVVGSVEMLIVQSEEPEEPRRRYSIAQLDRTAEKFDSALENWGWQTGIEVKRLFLVRQMIARRLGFSQLHQLFTGPYASAKAQNEYEKGTHFLLKPFTNTILPLVSSYEQGEPRALVDVLRKSSPTFSFDGSNKNEPLQKMLNLAETHARTLSDMWRSNNTRHILLYCREHDLLKFSERLCDHLDRAPRHKEFDPENDDNVREKADWLADEFFNMPTVEIENYSAFVTDNTPLSTQHGVKGEQYDNVLVVFDDVEAAWNQYSFAKTLTPQSAGEPTDGQKEKSRKLAYVCFSRAIINLRILFFSQNAEAAQKELIETGLLSGQQISIL